MAPKLHRIEEIPNLELGEGPHWDDKTQSLYLVDIFGKSIHKFIPASGKYTKSTFDKPVSLIVPVKGKTDEFVITLERELWLIQWNGENESAKKIKKLVELDQGTQNRCNDGKCDPQGRLWTGTMGPEPENGHIELNKGSFYSYDKNGKVKQHETKVGCSNGLAWNKELRKFYYIDTFKGTLDQFDYDIDTGIISNRKPIFTVKQHTEGLLDGMTIDKDGNLWLALFNGFKVISIDPRKPETVLQTIEIPAKQVTSVAWGGPKLDILYVTTASFTVDGLELPPPNHGATYAITDLGTNGLPADTFNI